MRVSQRFCNILVDTSFEPVYHTTEIAPVIEDSCYGW